MSSNVHGRFPTDIQVFDVDLPSDIQWIVGTNAAAAAAVSSKNSSSGLGGGGGGPQFVLTTQDGSAYIISNDDTEGGFRLQQLNYTQQQQHSERPPLVRTSYDDTTATSITQIVEFPPSANLSSLSHPIPVFPCTAKEEEESNNNNGILCGIFVYIDTLGNIILYNSQKDKQIGKISNMNVLPDARLIMSPKNVLNTSSTDNAKSKLLAVYGGAATFNHCVLGDCLEGSTLLIIQVTQNDNDDDEDDNVDAYSITLEREIKLPSGDVFEGLSPMFIDDGHTIVTTVASSGSGARLRSYDVFCGEIISESDSIGWGWRHLLFYNTFGSSSSSSNSVEDNDSVPSYLVDVLTPHVRKELQFFDISTGNGMELKASTGKYTTHAIGWRYLDTAVSADLNGDGINEAILLDENLERLGSFQLSNDGESGVALALEEVWSLPLIGKLTSNIAAVAFNDNDEAGDTMNQGVALAAASGSSVRIWVSSSHAATENDNVVSEAFTESSQISATTDSTETEVLATATSSTKATVAAWLGKETSMDNTEANNEPPAAPKNCGAQPNLARGAGIKLTACVVIMFMLPWTLEFLLES